METDIRNTLDKVRSGELSVEEAAKIFQKAPIADLGYANIDLHRATRQGSNEVIYGAGKTAEQIIGICKRMMEEGQRDILITRIDAEKAAALQEALPLHYIADGQIGRIGENHAPDGLGDVLIVCAGTSDIPVATEAAAVAEFYGNSVTVLTDVGVAGIHRLLAHLDSLLSASVIIVIAGMEGALASAVGGLVDCPVIAVPTSVGYGAAFEGLTALLAMLNSCAPGISVVNIDNGFGAAYLAHKINHMRPKERKDE